MDNSDITQNNMIEPKNHHKIIINEPFFKYLKSPKVRHNCACRVFREGIEFSYLLSFLEEA